MQHFHSRDGLKLAYSDEGSGVPLLCLAGLTRCSRDFDYLAPHLSDVRLIRMDYRGRGASDWAPDHTSYTIANEAQDVLTLLDHLRLEKIAVLGTSRGGLIAMVLAAMAKERLLGVCLNDIGPEIDAAGLGRITDYIGRAPGFKTAQDMAAAMPIAMTGFKNVPPGRWLQEVQVHTAATPDGLALTYDPALRDAVIEAGHLPAPDLWPLFDGLQDLPLGLIRGANSDLLSVQTAREMRRRRPDMLFSEIPDRGHVPFLDEAGAVNLITTWLESCL